MIIQIAAYRLAGHPAGLGMEFHYTTWLDADAVAELVEQHIVPGNQYGAVVVTVDGEDYQQDNDSINVDQTYARVLDFLNNDERFKEVL